MRIFLLIYTAAIVAASLFTLALVPRALKDLGHERQRLEEQVPGASFEGMLEAGYRLNTLILLVELLYYFLLLRYASSEPIILYGAFAFGVIHIAYLISGRWERRRLARGMKRTRGARTLIWVTAALTVAEVAFLFTAGYMLLGSIELSAMLLPYSSIGRTVSTLLRLIAMNGAVYSGVSGLSCL